VAVTAGSTNSEAPGTIGTAVFLAFTAGSNGSFVESVLWMPTASATTTTTATVGRVYVSSISSGATSASNCFLIAEVNLAAVSADSSSAAANAVEVPVNRRIPANWTILVSNYATPQTNTQWIATAFGGDY
jgi:hypothetical protein